VKAKGKYGFIDSKGKIQIEPIYEEAQSFRKEGAVVMKDGKYGIINQSGNIIFALEYDKINFNIDGMITFEKNGKKALFYPTQMRFIYKEKGF
jgi:hypothetical protein